MTVKEPMTVQEAGRKGGQATLQRYGRAHYQKAGRIGGKRRAQKLADPKGT